MVKGIKKRLDKSEKDIHDMIVEDFVDAFVSRRPCWRMRLTPDKPQRFGITLTTNIT